MELTVIERDDDISQVALAGRLDVTGMHEIDVRFHGATASHQKPTIVDMSGVDFIASLGMGMLVGCARSLARHDAKMVLLNPQELVENALKTAKIDMVIPIAHSLEEAEEKVRSQ